MQTLLSGTEINTERFQPFSTLCRSVLIHFADFGFMICVFEGMMVNQK